MEVEAVVAVVAGEGEKGKKKSEVGRGKWEIYRKLRLGVDKIEQTKNSASKVRFTSALHYFSHCLSIPTKPYGRAAPRFKLKASIASWR